MLDLRRVVISEDCRPLYYSYATVDGLPSSVDHLNQISLQIQHKDLKPSEYLGIRDGMHYRPILKPLPQTSIGRSLEKVCRKP